MEFPLLEACLPMYSFVDIDIIMPACTTVFDTFHPLSCDVSSSLISKLNKTTCVLDPFPTKLLMSHLSSILDIILCIVNLCFSSGVFPTPCKSSIKYLLTCKSFISVKASVRNICQHNYYCMQHCHFVNSTQISEVIKRLRFGKSDGVDDLYSDNFKHGTSLLFHCISVIINCMLCHGYAPTSFLHAAVIPIPKNTKLNLSSSCNYRAIALSSIFSKILDKTIMSLQSKYLMTSELQFGFKEHSSTIMCSTLLVETVEYYVSNNSTVYVLLIDASKAFDRLCHSKLFEVLETYNVALSLDDYCIIFILVLKCMCSGTPLNPRHFP